MKRKELQMLLIVIGVLVAFLSYQFVFKSYQEKTETVEKENETLQARVDQLEILNAKKSQYIADTQEMEKNADAIIRRFPAGVKAEDVIMYINNMELVDINQVAIPAFGIGSPAEIPYKGITEVEGFTLADEGIRMYQMSNSISFRTTYSGLKSLLNYIYGMDTRKAVTSVSVSASSGGYLTGSMALSFYYLEGTDYSYIGTDILGVPLGNDNFFGVITGDSVWTADDIEDETEGEGEAEPEEEEE